MLKINKAVRVSILMCSLLFAVSFIGSGYSSGRSEQIELKPTLSSVVNSSQSFQKNETVYGILNNNGSVKSVEIVNHLYAGSGSASTETENLWLDYGNYTEIVNLTDERQPDLKIATTASLQKAAVDLNLPVSYFDGMQNIVWQARAEADLYYQGTSELPLPWEIQIDWLLDGKQVTPEQIGGSSGNVVIKVSVEQAETAADIYKTNYILQISVPLSMDKAKNVLAPGATEMIAGKTRTLAYTVLSGQSASHEISFQANDFSMDPVQISAVLSTVSVEGFDDLIDGVSNISQAQSDIANGSIELSDGLLKLIEGLDQIYSGLDLYAQSGDEFATGLNELTDGILQLKTQLVTLNNGSQLFATGLSDFAMGSAPILTGYMQLEQQMSQLLLPEQTKAELQQLLALPDQLPDGTFITAQKELAQSLLSFDGAIGEINLAFSQLNSGLAEYTEGAEALANQYGELQSGIAQIPGGIDEILAAFNQINSGFVVREQALDPLMTGLDQSLTGGRILPGAASDLADGQSELSKALKEIENSVSGMISSEKVFPQSFAAPGLVYPESVQFLMRTEGISN